MKRILFIAYIITLLNYSTTTAQHAGRSESSASKYDELINQVRALAVTDYNQALIIAEEAYELAQSAGDTIRIVQSGRICGQLLNNINRHSDALEILSEVMPIAERNNLEDDYKTILSNIANAYIFQGKYDLALNLHLHALSINESVNDSLNIGFTLNNIGLVYYKMKNFKEAVKFYKKALDLQLKLSDQYNIERLYINISLCYNHMNEYEEAKQFIYKAFEQCKDSCLEYVIQDGHHGLGISYFQLGDFQNAQKHFDISYEAAMRGSNQRFIAENLFWLAKIDFRNDNLPEVMKKLYLVAEIAKAENLNELLVSTYERLSEVYNVEKDYKNAASFLKKYISLKDSLYNEHVIANLAKAKSDYEQRQNLAIIKANEMTIAQQQKVNLAVTIVTILAVLFVLVLWWTNRAMKRVNTQLETAQNLIFEQNRKLEIHNVELDRLVEKKTDELKHVNLSLQQTHEELDTFIHKTAQDIRAPLSSLKGICNVALMDIKEEASLVYLHRINSTTAVLNSILQRLLAINMINHSKITPTEIDLKSLIDNVISLQMKKGIPQNLVVRQNVVKNAIIHTDKELMSLLLENSLDNALKFCRSSKNDEHFIEINVAPNKDGRVSVRVVNNGRHMNENVFRDLGLSFHNPELDIEEVETDKQDLYFVKTAAKKIGGKVKMQKTPEGYNELSVVF